MGARGLKIAVCGKGGVGKTLVAGVLARLLAREGFRVLAVDCDSNPNLYATLGVPEQAVEGVVPISEDLGLVEERTGARPGSGWGSFFKLTPKVDDIPSRYSLVGPDGVRLLIVGSPPRAGSGCLCPSLALVRELLRHLVLYERDVVILDMEAGLEHFGRAVARGVDLMLLVAEPTEKAVVAVGRMAELAKQMGVNELWAVVNKVMEEREAAWAREKLEEGLELPVRAVIPFDSAIIEADRAGLSPLDVCPSSSALKALGELKDAVVAFWASRGAG
ncbi:hypothetical protein DRO33_02510 [Candidatus Bathyarchaeota archaeon]|nr:MAG: hypothetical protein DRO33_02510 [Candidatus Bathyarchaeota archaeon]